VHDNHLRRITGVVDDLDLARLDDKELEVALAGGEERLPVPVQLGRRGGTFSQFGDLGFGKSRESYRPCSTIILI
jgi:hypothetical protein